MKIFDAHCHLTDLQEYGSAISEAKAKGVERFISCGTSPKDWQRVLKLSEQFGDIITPAIGLHPWDMLDVDAQNFELLEHLIKTNPNAIIGEIGFDKWKPHIANRIDEQKKVFDIQIELAKKYNRPIVIHCLKAWGILQKYLHKKDLLPSKFMVHSYNGSSEFIGKILKRGGYISLSASVLRLNKKQDILKRMLKDDGINKLMIETDSPSISPYGKNEINKPENLLYICEELAKIAGIRTEELAEISYKNSMEFRKND